MSYNGSGTFQINTSGQPVVAGTVISSTAFNALTADLATGLSTAITKDGQTTTTVRIPFAAGINSSLTTDSTNTTSGSIITAGGVGVAKALFVGTTANIAGVLSTTSPNITTSITTPSTSFDLINATATTLNLGGAATAVNVGAATGTMTVANTTLAAKAITASTTLSVTGVTTVQAGTALLPAITTTGDTNTGIFFPAADTIAFSEGGSEAARFDSSSNLLIGSTSNSFNSKIYVTGTPTANAPIASFYSQGNSSTSGIGIYNDSASVGIWTSSGDLIFRTNGNLASGAETARITSAGLLQFNSGYGSAATAYGCRAWVNFNGTGTVAIRASGNVTSITDNGVGDYTVNFTTAMPDANYSAVAMGQEVAGPSLVVMYIHRTSPYATGSVRLAAINSSTGGVADTAFVNVAILR